MKNPFKKSQSKPIDLENPLAEEESLLNEGITEAPVHSKSPANLFEDIAELVKAIIELIHNKREEVFIERYAHGYTYARKNGDVYFKRYEDARKDLQDLEWEEPEPAPQLSPFEAMSLPKEPTKHHL